MRDTAKVRVSESGFSHFIAWVLSRLLPDEGIVRNERLPAVRS